MLWSIGGWLDLELHYAVACLDRWWSYYAN